MEDWIEEVKACLEGRRLSNREKTIFLVDHLEGEPQSEIKPRPHHEKENPHKIIEILRSLYDVKKPFVVLQQHFYECRQDGELSHALMSLMDSVLGHDPDAVPSSETVLRDQFMEHVHGLLRQHLREVVRG